MSHFIKAFHKNLEDLAKQSTSMHSEKDLEQSLNHIYAFLTKENSNTPFRDKLFQLQLKKIARLNKPYTNGKSLIHYVAKYGSEFMMKKVLEKKINIDTLDNNHFTPLHHAIMNVNIITIKYLLEMKSNIHAKSNLITGKKSAIHLASSTGNIEILLLLLSYQANINQKMFNQHTALHIACIENQINSVLVLLGHDASIDEQTFNGKTALHLASQKGNDEIIEILLRHKIKQTVKDVFGNTALHYATAMGHTGTVKILLEKTKIHPRIVNNFGMCCFKYAERFNIKGKNKKILAYLKHY